MGSKHKNKTEVVAEVAEAFTSLKKLLGRPKNQVGRTRRSRQRRGLRQAMERQDGNSRLSLPNLDRYLLQQVSSLERPLRNSQRTQRLGPPRSLDHRSGTAGHLYLRPEQPARRLSAIDLHDDRPGRRGVQSFHRLSRPQQRRAASRTIAAAVQKRNRFPAAP